MIETIRHLLGICGENHPSLLTIIFGASGLGFSIKYFYFYYGEKIQTWRQVFSKIRRKGKELYIRPTSK